MIEEREVAFFSDGLRLVGTVFRGPAATRASIVLCQGNVGIRQYSRFDEIARYLGSRGYRVLSFDHRGFGQSEGTSGVYRPSELIRDIRAGIEAVLAQSGDRAVGLFGSGFGGATAIAAAAEDARVAAVVALAPVGDAARWVRSLHRYYEWRELLRSVAGDQASRAATGRSREVLVDDVILPSPKVAARRAAVPVSPRRITLESVEQILSFRAEERGRALRAPLAILHSEHNELVPLDEGIGLYRAAQGPKRLVVFPGAEHHDAFTEPLFQRVTSETADWFDRWMPLMSDTAAIGRTNDGMGQPRVVELG